MALNGLRWQFAFKFRSRSSPVPIMVSPAMLKGMNTEVYGEGHPFGDPSWYQAYNTPYYNDTHKQFRKLMREYVDEHIMSNVHDWDEKGVIPKEMYLEAGKQGTLALCIGRPWPEKYFGPSPWGFEPDYFHELIMYDEMSRTGSVGFQWGIAGGTTIGLPPVYHHGSEELKQRVMPPCVKGEKVCCLAITAPRPRFLTKLFLRSPRRAVTWRT